MGKLPSIRSLRALEAVSRLGTIKAASEDLEVSPGAITQQIQLLERRLNVRLTERAGGGMRLTTFGRAYLPHVVAAFEQLHDGELKLSKLRHSRRLIVSALPSLAHRWLSRLSSEWAADNPSIKFILDGSDEEPHLEDGEADFRVSYGSRRRHYQRYTHLYRDFLVPVGCPALVGDSLRLTRPKDVLAFPLLWVDWGPEFPGLPTWRDWLTSQSAATSTVRCDLTFSLSSAAIEAAIEGKGLVLAQHSLVAGALKSGTLVQLFTGGLALPEDYFLAWNTSAVAKPAGQSFRCWLTATSRRFEHNAVLKSTNM
jgi:LysR family glycine cleavage system transcriptional activator